MTESPPPDIQLEAPTRKGSKRWCAFFKGRCDTLNPFSAADRRRASEALGVTPDEILAAVLAFQAAVEEPEPAVAAPFAVKTRGGEVFTGSDPLEAIDLACAAGPEYLRWVDTTRLCAADFDVVAGRRYGDTEPEAIAHRTGADRAWITRSGGLRLVFAERDGVSGLERALLGIYLTEIAKDRRLREVELLHHTRTPTGRVARRLDRAVAPLLRYSGQHLAELDPELVAEWLADRGLEMGVKVEHEFCPINPGPGSASVIPLGSNIWCHRCGRGVPYAFLLGAVDAHLRPHWLEDAARERVHAAHVEAVLRAEWPRALPQRPRVLYRAVLAASGMDDPKMSTRIFDRSTPWLRGEGGVWLHADTLRSAKVDKDGTNALSWARSGGHRSQLSSDGHLAGYREVRACGVLLRPELVPPEVVALPRHQIYQGDLPTRDEALDALGADWPGLDEQYLDALLCACVCAEGGGQPIIIYVWGVTGTAKTYTVSVVGALLGARAPCLSDSLPGSQEKWATAVGEAMASGDRPVGVHEVEKIPAFHRHITKILTLQDPIEYRPLFRSRAHTAFRAPIILTGISAPEWIRSRQEAGRRLRVVHLTQAVPRRWDGSLVRDWHPDGPHAPAVARLIRDAMEMSARHGYRWPDIADELGLEDPLSDNEYAETSAELHRELYLYCTTPGLPLSPARRFQPAALGWLDLTTEGARAVLDPLMPSTTDPSTARWLLGSQLQSVDWARVLGLDVPVIWEQRLHGSLFVGRFREVGLGRGRGRRNAELPCQR